jgi:hypothetical protein
MIIILTVIMRVFRFGSYHADDWMTGAEAGDAGSVLRCGFVPQLI